MTHPARLAWLFDIDGTLIRTDRTREAVSQALRVQLGLEDDLQDIAFAGRTDPLILADILRKHGRELDDRSTTRFWAAACANMESLLRSGRGRVLPGVDDLLLAIAAEPGWVVGLLTGNTTPMARVKLGHFGLLDRFAFGTFGEEAVDRDGLARIAAERCLARAGIPASRCVVVGDTEHDVACARAAGAWVVAVATGTRSRDDLMASEPDLLLDDLSDAGALLDWARGLPLAETQGPSRSD